MTNAIPFKLFTKSLRAGAAALLLLPALAVSTPDDPPAEQNDAAAEKNAAERGTTKGQMVEAVERELRNAQGLDGEAISVELDTGMVALNGEVANLLAHDRAIRIAASVKGVVALEDNLTVRPTDRSDGEIETDVATALAQDPATEFWEIDAHVQGGAVSLTGTVESYAEKSLAAKAAKGVRGVLSVDNSIDVNYEVDRTDRQIAHDVTQTLKWNTTVDSAGVEVEVDNGAVSLSGTVDSLYEKYQAERLSYVAGVNNVKTADLQVRWSDDEADQSALKQLSDVDIKDAVHTALVVNPRVSSFEPTIEVENGVVTLGGTVDNLKAKGAAAQAAWETLGVTEVRNQITVDPERTIADEDIERNVEDALLRDPYVSGIAVDVAAVDGEVYLYGDVDSWFDKLEARDVAARITGVTEVHNLLDVDYQIPVVYTFYDWDPVLYDYDFDFEYVGTKPDHEIAESIETELAWSPFVDAGEVEVEVESGVATLTGKVDDGAERMAATENALEGGAYKVVNRLDVSYDQSG